jgi:hypothetical protein
MVCFMRPPPVRVNETLHVFIRASCGATLLLAAGNCLAGPPLSLKLSGGLGFGYDSNPANAESGNTVPATGYATASLAASYTARPDDQLALLLRGSVEGQQYFNYVGLSNAKSSVLLRALYRPNGGFLTPTFAAWGSAALWQFGSGLRNSAEYRGGIYGSEQLSTAIDLRLGGYYSDRRSTSSVFDLENQALTLDADWLLSDRLTAYLGYEFRYGSFTTSSPTDAGAAANAAVKQTDDAIFRDGVADIDYRLKGHAQLGTLGLNYALTPSLALDAQTLSVHTRANDGDHYIRWLTTVDLLARF